MDNVSLVSVVVPVYNVEKYLNRCVDSILKQTYRKLEIILVDDGSSDSSGEICEKLKITDNRIQIIHKINGGLASARNAGIKAAKGEYIIFVDSDDWISLDTIEYAFRLINKYDNKADIVQYGVLETDTKEISYRNKRESVQVLGGKDILDFLMKSSTKTDTYFSACRCMYRTSIVKKILFVEGKINEDISWKYRILSQAKIMIDSNQIKYFYFQSTGSITTEGLKQKDFDLYDAANDLILLTQDENYGNIRMLAKVKSARTPFSLLCKIAFYGIADASIDNKKIVSKLVSELRKNLGLLIKSPMPVNRKIIAIMMSINFEFTKLLISFLKRFL